MEKLPFHFSLVIKKSKVYPKFSQWTIFLRRIDNSVLIFNYFPDFTASFLGLVVNRKNRRLQRSVIDTLYDRPVSLEFMLHFSQLQYKIISLLTSES